jgi:hypothetical protein
VNDATLELIDTPVTDIVERLRSRKMFLRDGISWIDADCVEAADEIERLREQVQRLIAETQRD